MEKQLALIRKFYNKYLSIFHEEDSSRFSKELIAFQRKEFGVSSYQQDVKFKEWMFRNPKHYSNVYCKVNEDVVGQQSGMAFELCLEGQPFNAAYAVDLKVRPDWKMKGLGVALIGSVIEKYDVLVGLGVSDEAHSMFIRQGWIDKGELNFYIKPLSTAILRDTFTDRNLLLFIRNLAALVYSRILSSLTTFFFSDDGFFQSLEFTKEHENLCKKIDSTYTGAISKTSAYLNWRFNNCPYDEKYETYNYVDNAGELRGFLVVRVVTWNNLKALMISEVYAEESVRKKMIGKAIDLATMKKLDTVLFQGIDLAIDKSLLWSGFIKRKSGTRFLVYSKDDEIRQILGKNYQWKIGFSESDLDFHFFNRT